MSGVFSGLTKMGKEKNLNSQFHTHRQFSIESAKSAIVLFKGALPKKVTSSMGSAKSAIVLFKGTLQKS
jgi:hypothetical protein